MQGPLLGPGPLSGPFFIAATGNSRHNPEMDRCGIFVDAGHLLAEGGRLCCGTHERKDFACKYPELIEALIHLVLQHARLPLLRMYWYDATANAIPTRDHHTIGGAPNVKLRLGRVIYNRQKGVDALIFRDLMMLARERAIATAYLLAGDEDVREGVVTAQDMGVRVVLIGIKAMKGSNQSEFLVREADDHITLDGSFLATYFAKIVRPPASDVAPADTPETARRIGAEFARSWATQATPDEIQRLLGLRTIPDQLDVELLTTGEQVLGTLQDKPDYRETLRDGFWKALGRVRTR